MEDFIIKSKKTGVEIELHETLIHDILKIIYVRNRKPFNELKDIYEKLKQENFDFKILDRKLPSRGR